jgi:hypothetical protein
MTVGRRASKTRQNPFAAGFAAPSQPPASSQPAAEPVESGGVVASPALPEPEKARMSKYTALLDAETAAAFDELALMARRKLQRRVDKSQLIRALILLAADDGSLREQVIDEVGKA